MHQSPQLMGDMPDANCVPLDDPKIRDHGEGTLVLLMFNHVDVSELVQAPVAPSWAIQVQPTPPPPRGRDRTAHNRSFPCSPPCADIYDLC